MDLKGIILSGKGQSQEVTHVTPIIYNIFEMTKLKDGEQISDCQDRNGGRWGVKSVEEPRGAEWLGMCKDIKR